MANFCVSLPHRRSTTVSLKTNPFIISETAAPAKIFCLLKTLREQQLRSYSEKAGETLNISLLGTARDMFLTTFGGERPNCNLSIPVVSIGKYTYLFC